MAHLMEVILLSIWDVRIGVSVAAVYEYRPAWALVVATSSSMGAVIPAMGFIRGLALWNRRRLPNFHSFLMRLTHRHRNTIERYGYVGVGLLVAIPLPGTGPWTGALCAVLLRMEPVRASMALAIGILTAGLVALGVTEGIISLLPFIS